MPSSSSSSVKLSVFSSSSTPSLTLLTTYGKFRLRGNSGNSIFGGSSRMKRLFNRAGSSDAKGNKHIEHPGDLAAGGTPTGKTLDRLVNAKEEAQRRWVEQQDEFVRRRRDHEMRMIAMEATEADRREEEIRRRIEGLDEQKRKNRLVQEAVAEQLKSLEEKLHEYKVRHKADEESVEDEIATLEDTLAEVKVSLERRKRDLEAEVQAEAVATTTTTTTTSLSTTSLPAAALSEQPSAPPAPGLHPDGGDGSSEDGGSVYPTLPVAAARSGTPMRPQSQPEENSRFTTHWPPRRGTARAAAANIVAATAYQSDGSSPHMSGSSRSVTPKTDSDFDSSV